MALYQVRRSVPHATPEDIDASGFRALVCAMDFDGMRWVVSHWDRDRGEIYCIYEAESAEQLFEHARRSNIPCDEVREVVPVRPEDLVSGTEGGAIPMAHPAPVV
ncbi:MAG: nickel-binding protein [Dehalococcoidia bacterium]